MENKKEIIEETRLMIEEANKLEALMISPGWLSLKALVERKRLKMINDMMKSEVSVKKLEYNRGAFNFFDEIECEIRGVIDESKDQVEFIKSIKD